MAAGAPDTRIGAKDSEANLPFDYYTCKASQAFDQWFFCLTVGTQMSSYYRYGHKSSCGKHWNKLQLCMKMKVRSEEAGKKLMREYRTKEESKRDSLPNVLDVWPARENMPKGNGQTTLDNAPEGGVF
ncbi:hypothetical protein GGF46_000418 [Coemansia sp. RSA 552]|nr:hypothetical protein GGF46_000418 [Coemansia sp. RSA 552]